MTKRARAARARRMRDRLAEDPGLVLRTMVPQAVVEEQCRKIGYAWRKRLFTPMVTLWTFAVQVLAVNGSCRKAVATVLTFLAQTKGNRAAAKASHDPSGYCRARKRLPLRLLVWLTRRVAEKLAARVHRADLWHGHRVKLVDGSTVRLADTPENQEVYPQPKTQKPGCGFPSARIVGVFDLLTGALADLAVDALTVAETTLFRSLWGRLEPGDVVVADRYYSSYADMALLLERGVFGVWRLHQRRKADFRKGTRLGHNDCLDVWKKPHRRPWLSPADYARLPKTFTVRLLRVRCPVGKGRVRTVTIATTLLDPVRYPAADVAALYRRRWEVETDFDHLKTTLHMNHLRSMSPPMVKRELWAHLLAYNLIRTVMWDAGTQYGVNPLRLSLKATTEEILATWPHSAHMRSRRALDDLYDQLLAHVAGHKVPHRPDRLEPRVRKWRGTSYPVMGAPRSVCRRPLPAKVS